MICTNCSSEVQPGGRFCSACGVRLIPPYIPLHESAVREGLVRPREGRVVAGVCAGFARRFGWDPILVRLVLVAGVLVGCGSPILAYIVAWFVMPEEPFPFAAYAAAPPPPTTPVEQPQV